MLIAVMANVNGKCRLTNLNLCDTKTTSIYSQVNVRDKIARLRYYMAFADTNWLLPGIPEVCNCSY